jgi:Fe2+ or Zn2+ uptake regulation protein
MPPTPDSDPLLTPGAAPIRGTDDLVALLRARGQRVTSQRLVILRELRRQRGHATAEEIHRAVHRDLPGTSTPTVYAALDLLVELGLARKLDIGIGVSLYDARTEPHQHMVCRRCGLVADLEVDLDAEGLLHAGGADGFHPEGLELLISGVCADCAGDAKAREPYGVKRTVITSPSPST